MQDGWMNTRHCRMGAMTSLHEYLHCWAKQHGQVPCWQHM
jgi:hypothetical protein